MNCPLCESQMEETTSQGVVIDRCGSCYAVWLDAGELDAYTKWNEQVVGAGTLSPSDSACGRCNGPLGRLPGAGIVEHCPSCRGFLLDATALKDAMYDASKTKVSDSGRLLDTVFVLLGLDSLM